MKKLSLLLLAIATLTFVACDKNGDSDKKEETTPKYAITVVNIGNGLVLSDVANAEVGTTVTLTATPADGYVFRQWVAISGDVTILPDATTNPATFTMPAGEVCIKAEFAGYHAVTLLSNDDKYGTAQIDKMPAVTGETITLTAIPAAGYKLKAWTVIAGGVTLSPDATTNPATFTMPPGVVSVVANFAELYNITTTNNNGKYGLDSEYGTIQTDKEAAIAGETVTLTAIPAEGYKLRGWTVTAGDITLSPDATTNPVTFTMPAGDVSIYGEFGVIEDQVVINGVTWATCNVDAPGKFVASPHEMGMEYQWDRRLGWNNENPRVNSDGGTKWNDNPSTNTCWTSDNDPCPEGWHVPDWDKTSTLLVADKVASEWTTLNGVHVCKFTDKTSGNAISFPLEESNRPDIHYVKTYWTASTHSRSDQGVLQGRILLMNSNSSSPPGPLICGAGRYRTWAFPVRCIR